MGVYSLINTGPNSQKIEVTVNGKFHCMSYPGDITLINNVSVGDRVTGIKPDFFNKKVIFEFILLDNDVED